MTDGRSHIYPAYAPDLEVEVEQLALRLKGDARLDFFFAPWHEQLGEPLQEQLEAALRHLHACAVFPERRAANRLPV